MYGNGNYHSGEVTRTTLRKYAERARENEQRARARNHKRLVSTRSSAPVVARGARTQMVRENAHANRRNSGSTRRCCEKGCHDHASNGRKRRTAEVQGHPTPGVERRRAKIRHFTGIWTVRCGECQTRFWGLGCNHAIGKYLLHIIDGDCAATVKARWKGAY